MAEAARRAAIGFSPHSGWAALVALAGDPASPRVVARHRIEMTDPRSPGSAQPYHDVEELPVGKAEERLVRYRETAGARAYQGLQSIVADLRAHGHLLADCGIIDSSGRQGSSLEAILASHALIHTADGEHFRQALSEAGTRCGLTVTRVRLKELLAQAARAMGRRETQIQTAVQALGRPLGPPWGADQKSAALIAWMILCAGPAQR